LQAKRCSHNDQGGHETVAKITFWHYFNGESM